MNLLTETIEALKPREPKDVLWVGTRDVWFTWDEFAAIADVEYDAGFGAPEVAQDLLVVGNGWWMSRGEYDGSEWWDIHVPPTRPSRQAPPKSLTIGQAGANGVRCSCGWEDLAVLNPE
jgi:hypothetical protein